MSEMISICGLNCNECGAFIATRDDDNEKRTQVAIEWAAMYEAELKASDINCGGCTSVGEPLFQHCTVCEIRKCGVGRGVVNCAHCEEYACGKLEAFFEMVPDCRKRLDAIRASL